MYPHFVSEVSEQRAARAPEGNATRENAAEFRGTIVKTPTLYTRRRSPLDFAATVPHSAAYLIFAYDDRFHEERPKVAAIFHRDHATDGPAKGGAKTCQQI